jgi:hypothetical protein
LQQATQVIRSRSKQHAEGVYALIHELFVVDAFLNHQAEMLTSLQLILDPVTRFRVGYDEFDFEEDLVIWQQDQLDADRAAITRYISVCDAMLEKLDLAIERPKDDQNPMVSVLTTTAVFLLCLCLAAWYSSISNGAVDINLVSIQSQFLQTAGLITFVVGAFCLGAANHRQLLQWAGQ